VVALSVWQPPVGVEAGCTLSVVNSLTAGLWHTPAGWIYGDVGSSAAHGANPTVVGVCLLARLPAFACWLLPLVHLLFSLDVSRLVVLQLLHCDFHCFASQYVAYLRLHLLLCTCTSLSVLCLALVSSYAVCAVRCGTAQKWFANASSIVCNPSCLTGPLFNFTITTIPTNALVLPYCQSGTAVC
jgi:hypothetical protein